MSLELLVAEVADILGLESGASPEQILERLREVMLMAGQACSAGISDPMVVIDLSDKVGEAVGPVSGGSEPPWIAPKGLDRAAGTDGCPTGIFGLTGATGGRDGE